MNKKNLLWGVFLLLFSFPAYSVDPVESLIKEEQNSYDQWVEENNDVVLPPGVFRPIEGGIELYSYQSHGGKENPLCAPLALDELAALSGLKNHQENQPLNLKLPRVRQFLSSHCLVRPGDFFLAVGREETRFVRVKDLLIQSASSSCPDVPKEVFSASLAEPGPSHPLFYMSSSGWEEGPTSWRAKKALPEATLTEEQRSLLEKAIPFLSEYRVRAWEVSKASPSYVAQVSRRKTTLEDVLLVNEAVVLLSSTEAVPLAIERVKKDDVSGSVNFEGVFDLNQDGFTDYWVSAAQNLCALNYFLLGGPDGLTLLDYPNEACDCGEIVVDMQ